MHRSIENFNRISAELFKNFKETKKYEERETNFTVLFLLGWSCKKSQLNEKLMKLLVVKGFGDCRADFRFRKCFTLLRFRTLRQQTQTHNESPKNHIQPTP